MTYVDVGDVATLTGYVRSSAGTLANADSVGCTVTRPDGTTTTVALANTATGTYTGGFTATQPGRHLVRWLATGVNASAYTDTFTVRDTTRLPVVSLTDAKAYLNITATTSDEELRRFLDVITDAGEQYTGRVFGRRTITETLSGRVPTLALSHCPILSITSVVESGVTLTTDDYALSSAAGGVLARTSGTQLRNWTVGTNNITVVYVAGYATQPPTDVAGAWAMLDHLWSTQRGTIRGMGGGDEWNPAASFSIPRRVQELWDLNVMGPRL